MTMSMTMLEITMKITNMTMHMIITMNMIVIMTLKMAVVVIMIIDTHK